MAETLMYGENPLGIVAGTAETTTYDNTTSGLQSDNVQDAIDEVNSKTFEILTKTFTVITTAQGTFYLDDLTESNSIIVQISSTEQYFYVFRVGGAGAWVGCALTGNITPVGETTIHVTVKYIAI